MATRYHNISGETTTELISAKNSNINSKSISIANTHATLGTYVDLYVGTLSTSDKNDSEKRYYLNKGYLLHKGESLVLNDYMPFELGLYIKLTGVGTTTPSVDVVIM